MTTFTAKPWPPASLTVQQIELRILTKLLEVLINDHNLVVTLDDSDIRYSQNIPLLLTEIPATDEATIFIHTNEDNNQPRGHIFLVFGNDGHDLISDHSVNLTEILLPVTKYADTFQ